MANSVPVPSAAALLTINVQGGNLFRLAALHLADAIQWNRIAALNGLYDFMLPPGQVIALKIPAVNPSGGNGGIRRA